MASISAYCKILLENGVVGTGAHVEDSEEGNGLNIVNLT
jgi:hypothetical protein